MPAGSQDGAPAVPAPLPSTGGISWGTLRKSAGYAPFSRRNSAKNSPRTSCFLLFNVYSLCWLFCFCQVFSSLCLKTASCL